jgi:hypothetical protein
MLLKLLSGEENREETVAMAIYSDFTVEDGITGQLFL